MVLMVLVDDTLITITIGLALVAGEKRTKEEIGGF